MSYEKRKKRLYLNKVNLHSFLLYSVGPLSKGFDTTAIDNDGCLFVDKFPNDFSRTSQNVKHLSQVFECFQDVLL